MATEAVFVALEAATLSLAEAGIPHALVGGVALPAWGRIRATADVDILISAGRMQDQQHGQGSTLLVETLRSAGFAHLERADRKKVDSCWILHFWYPLREKGISVRVDLILGEDAETDEILNRAVLRRVDGIELPVASCEDLVLLMLAAGRAIDLADAAALLAVNRDEIDWEYLHARADRRGLSGALDDARQAADRQSGDP